MPRGPRGMRRWRRVTEAHRTTPRRRATPCRSGVRQSGSGARAVALEKAHRLRTERLGRERLHAKQMQRVPIVDR